MKKNRQKKKPVSKSTEIKLKCWEGRTSLPIVASDQLVDPNANVTQICLS